MNVCCDQWRGHTCSFPWGAYLGMEMLDHMVGVCLTFLATARKLPSVAVDCNIPTSHVRALLRGVCICMQISLIEV